MEIKLYALPVGMYQEEFVTVLELAVPELLFSLNEQGNSTYDSKEEMDDKYEGLKELSTIQADEQQTQELTKLRDITKEETELKIKLLTSLETQITSAIEEANNSPQIQIASEADLRILSNQENSSKLIL